MRLILEQRYLFDGSVAHTAHHHDHNHEPGAEHESTTVAAVTNTAVDTPLAANAQGHNATTKSDSLTSVVFVDSRVADWQALTASLPDTVGVVVVSPDRDGMALVSQVLSEQHELQSVNFLTYGQSGEVTLGNSTINAATVMASSAQVTGWGDSLASGGQILFWGCDVGQGVDGKALVDDLHTLTGADIGASTDKTGMAQLGGDWTLEQTAGMTSSAVENPFSAAAMAGYDYVLDTNPTADVSFTGSADQTDVALLGGSFKETIQFKNTGGATGYSPYVEIFTPSNDQQSTPLQSLVMVDSSGNTIQTLTTQAITLVGDDASHPGQVGAYYKGIWAAAPTGLKAGDTMYAASLPFGSYTSGQPTINMVATFGTEASDSSHISQLSSTSGKNVILGVAGGYALGNSAVTGGSAPVQGDDATRQVSINLLDVTSQVQTSVGEDESPTGPGYPEHYQITLNPAPVTAGAAITGTTVTVTLPDQVIYTGGQITYTDAAGNSQTLTPSASHVTAGQPGGSLTLTLPTSLSSTTGAVTLDIPAYVGSTDAAGNSILQPDASSGNVAPTQTDALKFSYSANNWTAPVGSLDHAAPVAVSGSGTSSGNTSFDAKAFAIQEKVEDVTNTSLNSTGAALPNDVIKHTVLVENSDYYGSSGLVITATLSDGQTLNTTTMTPVFTYKDSKGVQQTVELGTNADGKATTNPDFIWATSTDATGKTTTTMTLNIADKDLKAALMLAGGSGQLVYYTTVNPQYVNANPVTEADTLTSDVFAKVNLLGTGTTPQPVLVNGTTAETATDTSHTSLSVPQGKTTLSVVGVNNVEIKDGEAIPPIKAGDLVTYKATYTLQTGTFNGLDLASYLPEPLFTTGDPNASGSSTYQVAQAQPDSSYISGANAGTYLLSSTSPTTVSIDRVTSSAQLNDVDFQLADSSHVSEATAKTVSLLFTVRATNAPFANGLLMTNQEQSTFTNGQGTTQATSVILQEQVGSPQAELKTGIVSVVNSSNAAATDVSYSVDGSGSAGKPTNYADANSTGSIFTAGGNPNQTGLVDQDNLNVTGVQGGESVRVVTTVTNTGDGGMYDLVVRGSTPTVGGSSQPASNLTITTSDGSVYALTAEQTSAYFSSTGLDLSTVVSVNGGKTGEVLAAQTKDASGAVTRVASLSIAYDVTLPKETSLDTTLNASANVVSYTNTANGTNFVTNAVPLGGVATDISDSATMTTQSPTLSQTVSGSTINGVTDTSGTDTANATASLNGGSTNDNTVVAGERRTTTINVTVPQGKLTNGGDDVTVTVTLPAGVSYVSNSGTITLAGAGLSSDATPSVQNNGDGTLTFDFGKSVTNTGASAGTITLTYAANYASMGGDGKTGNLTATLHYSPDQGSTSDTVVERDPSLSETITAEKTNTTTPTDPTTATALPNTESVYSGEALTYKVTLNNTSSVPAYDIAIHPTSQNLDNVRYYYNGQSYTDLSQMQKDIVQSGGLASGSRLTYYVMGTVSSNITAESNVSVADSGTYTSVPNSTTSALTTPMQGNFSTSNATPAVAKLGADLWIVGESNGTEGATPSLSNPQSSAHVVPGDIISLHGVASVPEGKNDNVTLTFTLPKNMTLDQSSIKLLLGSPDNAVTASNLDMSTPGLRASMSSLADAKTTAATVGLSSSNYLYNPATGVLTINLGTVADNAMQAIPVYAVVDMQATVNNSADNTSGTNITSQLQVSSGSHVSNTAQVSEAVLEPKVVLTKDVSAIDYAAGTVTYTETLKNIGTATAYGVTLTDPLAAQNESYVPGSLYIVAPGASSGAPAMSTNAMTGTMTLAKGATEQFTYTVALADKTQGAALSTATATWLSLKGVTQGGSTTGGVTQSRDGSGALVGVDTYTTSVTTGLAAVSGHVWQNLGNDPSTYKAGLDTGLGVTLQLTPSSGSTPFVQNVTTNATDGSYAALVAVYGTPTNIATVSVPTAGTAGLPAQETLIANRYGAVTATSDTLPLAAATYSATGGLVINNVNMAYAVPDTAPTLTSGGTVGWGQAIPVTGNADGQPVALGSGSVTVADAEIDKLIAQSQTGQVGDSYNGTVLTVQRYVNNAPAASVEDSFAGSGTGATGVVLSGQTVLVDGQAVGTLAQAGGKLQITFAANATAALIGQTIAGLTYTYTGSSSDPGLSKVIIGATLSDNNPTTSGPQGLNTATSVPLFSAVDIPPPSFATSYQEQNNPQSLPATAVAVYPGLSLQDASGGASPTSIQQAVIKITGGQAGEDVLAVAIPSGEGLSTSTGADGTLKITSDGTTTLAQWQAALQAVTYYNTSAEPTAGAHTVQIALYENNSTHPVLTNGTITVLAADNSPVLDPSIPVSLSTAERDVATRVNPGMGAGTAVSDLVGLNTATGGPGNVTDPDGANLTQATAGQGRTPGIAITDAQTTAGQPDGTTTRSIGTWLYTTDGGKTWTAFAGNGATTPPGGGNALHLVADSTGQNRIYFQPTQSNWNGTISNALTFRAWDQSDGAANGSTSALPAVGTLGAGINTAGAAYSSAAETLDLHVTANNNAPVATGALPPLAGREDTTAPAQSIGTLFGPTFFDVADQQHSANNPTGSVANTLAGVALTSDQATPEQGHWQYSTDGGKSWVDVPQNVSTTNALVLSASTQIAFVPAANFNGQPGGLTATLIDSSTDVPLYHNAQGVSVTGADLATSSIAQTGVDVSHTGGNTALSVASVPLTTVIAAVNDAPVASGSVALVMPGEVDPAHPYNQTVGKLFDPTFSDQADQQRSATNPTGSVANTLVGVAIISDGANPKTQGSWVYSSDGGKTWTKLDPTTVSPTSALVLPRNTQLSFLPVSGYAGIPGRLGAALIESGSPLANGLVSAGVDVSTMMHDPTGTLSHTAVMLHTFIPDARPHGLPSLPGVMQSGNPSGLALASNAIETVFVSPFERSVSAAHQTWVQGSSVYRFVSTDAESGMEVPMGAFITPNGTESQMELQASMADGSPLPNWMSFNSVGRVFNGTPPNEILGGTMDLKVVGHDMFGHQAQVDVHVVVGHKTNLTEMVDVSETPRAIHASMDNLQHSASALLFAPLPDVAVHTVPTPTAGKPALRSQLRGMGSMAHSRAARELLDRRAF
ncbi:DUF4347 domain-containing protein [Acetobacter okinawensis]|uniref:DUF4347 domain-containing protein n=1 Tax=Acetobacter okinawensis TaxID=1076594 RepID=A0A252BX88_9PROT|nr:DUF4347 domain-containing protein [Acetobacter okinawensis]OUJ13570.1 hypothetical protein HK26_08500 [Acetobacter okinawensis]